MYRGKENEPHVAQNPAVRSRWNVYYPTTSKTVYRSQDYNDVKILSLDSQNDWDTWNVPSDKKSFDRPYVKTTAC